MMFINCQTLITEITTGRQNNHTIKSDIKNVKIVGLEQTDSEGLLKRVRHLKLSEHFVHLCINFYYCTIIFKDALVILFAYYLLICNCNRGDPSDDNYNKPVVHIFYSII